METFTRHKLSPDIIHVSHPKTSQKTFNFAPFTSVPFQSFADFPLFLSATIYVDKNREDFL